MSFSNITSKFLFYILSFSLVSIAGCEADDPKEQILDGTWKMTKVTTSEDEIITEDLWGSVIWDFDVTSKELEVLVDYHLIIENYTGGENDPDGFFFGLTDGTYKLDIISDDSKNSIQIGDYTKGNFKLVGNRLILRLDYDSGQFTAKEIYYFEKMVNYQ